MYLFKFAQYFVSARKPPRCLLDLAAACTIGWGEGEEEEPEEEVEIPCNFRVSFVSASE